MTGQCRCRPNFGGRTCNECPDNTFGDPLLGCQSESSLCGPEETDLQAVEVLTGVLSLNISESQNPKSAWLNSWTKFISKFSGPFWKAYSCQVQVPMCSPEEQSRIFIYISFFFSSSQNANVMMKELFQKVATSRLGCVCVVQASQGHGAVLAAVGTVTPSQRASCVLPASSLWTARGRTSAWF